MRVHYFKIKDNLVLFTKVSSFISISITLSSIFMFETNETWNFSLRHHVQTRSGAHPVSYLVDNEGFFSGDKAARA